MVIGKLRAALGQAAKQSSEVVGNQQTAGKRFGRCVLHIGTEKTGTSTIQRFLTKNRKALARDGVIYPSVTGENGGTQWGFVACVQDSPWKTDVGLSLGIYSASDQEKYREELRVKLQREFAASPKADTLIISSEHLQSRLATTEAITRLKDFLDPWVDKFEIVFYLRRQDRMAVSFYSTKIKSGNAKPILFPAAMNGPIPYYFDYERLYNNWHAVFGAAAMRVRIFSPLEWVQGDLVQDFCLVCGLLADGKRMPVAENESINQLGVDFLLEVNKQIPSMIAGKRNPEHEALIQFVSRLCSGKSYPASREEAMAFYQRFVDGNERLRKQVFPGRLEPLFDEDFSDYLDKPEQLEPQYKNAVALAIRMWRAKN